MKSAGKYRILTLAAGLATACLIVFSQLFYFQAATYCQQKAETHQQKDKQSPVEQTDKSESEAYISIPSHTISSVSGIQISEGLALVLETLLGSEETAEVAETPLFTNRLFHALFRFIIASNAP